jgi:hypothetical protein
MESPAKQPKPLTVWKVAVGVCFGILMASAIGSVAYYFLVEQPARAEAARRAEIVADNSVREMEAENSQLEQQKTEMEHEIAARRQALQRTTYAEDDGPVPTPPTPLKYQECAVRDSSVSTKECETALSPDAPTVGACATLDRSSTDYRQCVVKSLARPHIDWK